MAPNHIIVCFDVDGTLIDSQGDPRYKVIDLLRCFVEFGYDVVVWSGAGMEFAEMAVRRLGLRDYVRVAPKQLPLACRGGSVPRPHIAVDDTDTCTMGTVNLKV